MAVSLKKRLFDIKPAVVMAVREHGIDGAMQLYNVRHRPTFVNWLEENTSEEWHDNNPFVNLTGGIKAKWLREHRNYILDSLEIFGQEWVIKQFHFTHDTLERFVKHDSQPFTRGLSRLERAELNAKEALREVSLLRTRVDILQAQGWETLEHEKQLSEAYYRFTELVAEQIMGNVGDFFKAMLERGLRPDLTPLPLPRPDLNPDSIVAAKEHDIDPGRVNVPFSADYLASHPMAHDTIKRGKKLKLGRRKRCLI